jgi:transposase-like protein
MTLNFISAKMKLMPQIQLPIFPSDSVEINNELGFKKESGMVTYFNGSMPVFSHDENDLRSFRMIMSQFYVNGNATQAELARAFGVTKISIKRAVKLYREKGINGFYAPRAPRGATILTPSVLTEVQSQLDNGGSVSDIAKHLDLKKNTLSKAIQEGRLRNMSKKKGST